MEQMKTTAKDINNRCEIKRSCRGTKRWWWGVEESNDLKKLERKKKGGGACRDFLFKNRNNWEQL